MSEFANAMKLVGSNLGLHVIQFPSKKFGFVGSVPADLLYVKADGSIPTAEEISEIRQSCSPAMVMKSLDIHTRVFDTQEQAIEFAESRGYEVRS